jgi:hypothetical protein
MDAKLDYKKIRAEEYNIGRRAAYKIKNSITKQLQEYGLVKSGTLSRSISSVPKMGEVRLFGIRTKMNHYGFIHQVGVNDLRTGHTRKTSYGAYSVKEHTMIMKASPFISMGIEKSGVFEQLVRELGALRSEEIILRLKGDDIKIK